MMELNSYLIRLGLTSNEAELYRTLSIHGEMTGYECAKLTGISRSNVYIALAGLCEKGGAYIADGSVQKYSPAPIGEFCANKRRELDASVKYLLKNMPIQSMSTDSYITIKGAGSIVDKMKNMISACSERIYISAESRIILMVSLELSEAIERKMKAVVMTDCEFGLNGAILYNMKRKEGQVRLIVDSRYVLTGDVFENQPCSCLFSQSDTLVSLFKESMKNEIKLIELGVI